MTGKIVDGEFLFYKSPAIASVQKPGCDKKVKVSKIIQSWHLKTRQGKKVSKEPEDYEDSVF